MGVNKLAILTMVFHTGTHATPHRLVRSGVNTVVGGTSGSEIDISAVNRMLGGKNVVEQGAFIKIGISCFRILSE